MKLITSPTSPYGRKVRVVLAEKRIDYELVIDLPWNPDSRVADVNPLGKVPALLLEDGAALYDSRVIVEYLDTVTPVSRLIPENPRQRTQVKRWEALADGLSDAAAAIVVEKKRPEHLQSQEWMNRQRHKIDRALEAAARDLGEKSWCAGDFYTLADIAVGCALGYLELRFPDIDVRGRYPKLGRLSAKLAERQSFKDTLPPA